MATKRRRIRKSKSRKKSRRSCKYGKLKRRVKTKSGRKRRCKKKISMKRRRKYRIISNCVGLRKTKNPKCEEQANCKWVVGSGCKRTSKKKSISKAKPIPKHTNERLFEAIDKGNTTLVTYMLDRGVDVNTTGGKYKMTLLINAAWRGNISLVKLLIRRGANVNAQDSGGQTALMYASNKVMVKALLDAGADKTMKSKDGKTALDFAMSGDGSRGDPIDPEIIRLLAHSKSKAKAPSDPSLKLSIPQINRLTQQINKLEDKSDMKPMDEYRKYSRYLNMSDVKDVEQGKKSFILLVLPDMNVMRLNKKNPLIRKFYPASEYGTGLWGETIPSRAAVLGGFPEKFVIINDSVIDYLQRRKGMYYVTVSKSKAKGINCVGLRKTKNPKCEEQANCKWVVGSGCKNKRKNKIISDQDLYGQMLRAAGQTGEYASTNDESIYQLLNKGVDVNAQYTKYGNTILMYAAMADNLDLAETLMNTYLANPNIKNYKGQTVLHKMVEIDDVDMVNSLLSGGADPNIRDGDGHTSLDIAKKYNQTVMIKILTDSYQPIVYL